MFRISNLTPSLPEGVAEAADRYYERFTAWRFAGTPVSCANVDSESLPLLFAELGRTILVGGCGLHRAYWGGHRFAHV